MTQCDLVWRLVALRVLFNVQLHCEDDRTNERTSLLVRIEQTEQARKKGPSPRSTQHSFVLARRLAIVAGDNDGFGV